MIICVCNNVSNADIDNAIICGVYTFAALQKTTKVGTCCGTCITCAKTKFHKTLRTHKKLKSAK